MKVSLDTNTVIWDLDGTILDSIGISYGVWKEVMPQHGRPVPTMEEILRSYHGTLQDCIKELVPDATHEELEALHRDFLTVDNEFIQDADHHFFEDAVRLAEKVHNAGLRQILVSNRAHGIDRKFASPRNIVLGSRLAKYIDVVVCGDEVEFRKPDARAVDSVLNEGAEVLVIGDQFVDAEFARNLGGRAILVCRDSEPLHLDRLSDGWEDHVDIVTSLDEVEL